MKIMEEMFQSRMSGNGPVEWLVKTAKPLGIIFRLHFSGFYTDSFYTGSYEPFKSF